MKKLAKFLPFFFLVYGLWSVFTLQRDFSHVTQLGVFVLLVGPAFMVFAMVGRLFESLSQDSKWARYSSWAKMANLSATQSLTQYILIFCLPFYVVRQDWIYFGVNILWLGTSLWDPLYEKLVQYTLYRHLLLAWSLLSASSFLFPFILPSYLDWFYPAMAGISSLAFIPTRKEKSYILSLLALWFLSLIPLLFLDAPLRFPLLSVWTKDSHFAFDIVNKETADQHLAKSISKQSVKDALKEGHTLCCVAPVVAPPGLRANIKQEWSLGRRVIESVQLKTPIQGNVTQQAFHSYFCKKNLPLGEVDERLRCRVQIGDGIDIGGSSIEIVQ
ncbi:MAG: hypothetical protein H7249_12655 [Chitinophagaceae bacterium]|nr:hypothetical protein [Oligoflexus sp.]